MPENRTARLLSELKRRRVFRVAVVYAAVAWAVMQVAGLVFPALDMPAWTLRLVILLAVLGFPIAVVLAWAFELTPDGVRRTAPLERARPAPAASGSMRRGVLWLVLVLVAGGAGVWVARRGAGATGTDADLVAVLPFRVAGADPRLAYLREGMVDLLVAKLSGAGATKTVDSRALLAAWRRAVRSEREDLTGEPALQLARELGAGRLLMGEVIGSPERLIFSASIVRVPGGRAGTKALVEGPADSLSVLVDRLAARLLAVESGEVEHRLAAATSTSLPALQAYLEGQQAYRSGRYFDALEHYRRAWERDSTFTLASLGLYSAGGWVERPNAWRHLARLWPQRHTLPPMEQVLLLASVGSRYPVIRGADLIEQAGRAVRVAPANPEAWFHYGDALFHYGAAAGEAEPLERAREAFTRSLALDSTFVPARAHLVDVVSLLGDTAAVRGETERALLGAPDEVSQGYVSWLAGATAGDEPRRLRAAPDEIHPLSLAWILGAAQARQVGLAELPVLLAALERRRDADLGFASASVRLNAGQPGAAWPAAAHASPEAWRGTAHALAGDPFHLAYAVFAGLYWDGDTAVAAGAARHLATFAESPAAGDTAGFERLRAHCVAEQWRMARGDFAGVDRAIARLRSAAPPLDPFALDEAQGCAVLLEALAATLRRRPDARDAVARLDALLAEAPDAEYATYGNIVLARLFDALGDRDAALAALRRRNRIGLMPAAFLSTFLREEGRLAAATGDRDGAIRAYSHYLAIRPEPEPAVRPEVERVRQELARLIAES
jgi:tetratricopeptide (TPR) repeat protein/TolB-like protein